MKRREVLKLVAFGVGASALQRVTFAVEDTIPVIDAHIHLFDPTRPGGVPWPEKSDSVVYRPVLPERHEALARPFGVAGAIAVEASPWASDNQWLLGIARKHPWIVGVIGNLDPSAEDFSKQLDALHTDPLFLGIRYGNLWNRDLTVDLDKPGFLDGLKALAQSGLVFESANPDPSLIRAILRVTERVPDLRVVIDHLPHATVPSEDAARREYESNLRRLAESQHVFVKLSEIPVRTAGRLVTDPKYYEAALDGLWNIFGDDRVIFGSDWPNSDHVATYAETFAIASQYVAKKPRSIREKYYWKNSIIAYRWRKRRSGQPAA